MKLKGLRWWIIGLIAVATIINYIDRSAINIMWPYIHKEFGIAEGESKAALAKALDLQKNAKNEIELEKATQLVDRHQVRLNLAGLRRRNRR